KWQAEQQAGKNHKNDAHGLEMEALSNGRNQKHGGQENRGAYVLVTCLSGFCTSFHDVLSFPVQTKELLVLGVVVVGHEDRARRRLRVFERIGPQPGCEGRPVLVAKTALKELCCLLLSIEFGREPVVEGVAVVDPLLSCQGSKAFSSDPKPGRLGVLLCTLSSPLRCLVTAPRSGQGDQGEDHRFNNFNRFKTGLRSMIALAHCV